MNPYTAQSFANAQTLLLQRPPGPAVSHLILQIPNGLGREAAALLRTLQAAQTLPSPDSGQRAQTQAAPLQSSPGNTTTPPPVLVPAVGFGVSAAAPAVLCSMGITFAGLSALGVPLEYLRVYRTLAPAFAEGAPVRHRHRGDGVANAPTRAESRPALSLDRVHVVFTLHGPKSDVERVTRAIACWWQQSLQRVHATDPFVYALDGHHLAGPDGAAGNWVHFGYRDDVSDVALFERPGQLAALDERLHAPGAVLLGCRNDANVNR